MESKPKPKNEKINTLGLGIEHIAYLDEETNYLLEAYQEKIGAATKNGAISFADSTAPLAQPPATASASEDCLMLKISETASNKL